MKIILTLVLAIALVSIIQARPSKERDAEVSEVEDEGIGKREKRETEGGEAAKKSEDGDDEKAKAKPKGDAPDKESDLDKKKEELAAKALGPVTG